MSEHFLGVGQLIEEQQAHVEQRPQDFVPVEMVLADGGAYLLEDAAQFLHLFPVEVVDHARCCGHPLERGLRLGRDVAGAVVEGLVDEQAFRHKPFGEEAVDGLIGSHHHQVAGLERERLLAHAHRGHPKAYELHLVAADAVVVGAEVVLAALRRAVVGNARLVEVRYAVACGKLL